MLRPGDTVGENHDLALVDVDDFRRAAVFAPEGHFKFQAGRHGVGLDPFWNPVVLDGAPKVNVK